MILSLSDTIEWRSFLAKSDVARIENIQQLESLGEDSEFCLIEKVIEFGELREIFKKYEAIYICYQPIIHYLADVLQSETDTKDAAKLISVFCEELLQIHKQSRRTLRLIDLGELQRASSENNEAFFETIGLKPVLNIEKCTDTMFHLLSSQLIAQNEHLSSIQNLLKASSLHSSQNHIHLDIESIRFEYIQTLYSLDDLASSKEHLLEQNAKSSELLIQSKNEHELIKSSLSSLQADFIDQTITIDRLEKELTEQKIAGSTSKQLHIQEINKAQQKQDLLQEKIEALKVIQINQQQQINTLIKEKTAIADDYASAVNKFNAEHERYSGKQLEVLNLQSEKQEIHDAHLREKKTLERELSKLESKSKELSLELISKTNSLQAVEYELEQIKSSTTWKLSSPMRLVTKRFKKSNTEKEVLKQNMALLYSSELFDPEWYLQSYQDVRETGIDPAQHYLLHGANEGRFPSASFDGDWYLERYPDIVESGINPLIHYIKFGMSEGRTASPKMIEQR